MGNELKKSLEKVYLDDYEVFFRNDMGIIEYKEFACCTRRDWGKIKDKLKDAEFHRLITALDVDVLVKGIYLERHRSLFNPTNKKIYQFVNQFQTGELDWNVFRSKMSGPEIRRLQKAVDAFPKEEVERTPIKSTDRPEIQQIFKDHKPAFRSEFGIIDWRELSFLNVDDEKVLEEKVGKENYQKLSGFLSSSSGYSTPRCSRGMSLLDSPKPSSLKSPEEEETMPDFLSQEFDQADFIRYTQGTSRVLVLGMGGGCDVFMAYTLANKIERQLDMSNATQKPMILYANCISERKDGIPSDHLTLVPGALFSVPPGEPRPIQKGENTYGTTLIEQSVPRGPMDSPLLIALKKTPSDKSSDAIRSPEQVEEYTCQNMEIVEKALEFLQVDLIIGVDCGGDSLTSGKDFSFHPLTGRDHQVLYAFRKYRHKKPDFKFIHIVLGPGCDGETPRKDMALSVMGTPEERLYWCEGRKYLGAFQTDDMIEECFPLVQNLEMNRTPYLMYRALKDSGEFCLDRPQENDEWYDPNLVKIARHGNFQLIPRIWLLHGLVFEYEDGAIAFEENAFEVAKKLKEFGGGTVSL